MIPAGTGSDASVLDQAQAWLAEGRGVALATVVSTWGSAPRPAGSHLAVAEGGAFVGSVSGGCIEASVITGALEVIRDGRPRSLDFGVSDETAWSVGLPCGGAVRVFVEPLGPRFERLQALRRRHCPAAVVTDVPSGTQGLVTPDGVTGALPLGEEALKEVRRMLADDESGPFALPVKGERGAETETGPAPLFVRSYSPPWELVIVGAVHIAQALAPMAAMAGFAVTVVDPRSAFATDERFPGTRLAAAWPDRVLAEAPPGPHTAVVTLTHDARIDEPALAAAVRSQAFYIGALGSRRTHAKRLERLAAAGLPPEQLTRIAGPIGLDIGARTPAEIAVAVVAEIVGARHGRRRPR